MKHKCIPQTFQGILQLNSNRRHRKGLADISLGSINCPHTRIDGQKRKYGKEKVKTMESKLKKKGTPPPRYDEAFKAGAVRMVTEQRREPKEVARDLGICIDILRSRLKGAGMQMGQISRHNRDQQRIRELEA